MILGTDYFQFSYLNNYRNYVYGRYFGEDFLKLYGVKEYCDHTKSEHFIDSFHPRMLKRISFKEGNIYLKQNGQFIRPGKSKKGQFLRRSTEIIANSKRIF